MSRIDEARRRAAGETESSPNNVSATLAALPTEDSGHGIALVEEAYPAEAPATRRPAQPAPEPPAPETPAGSAYRTTEADGPTEQGSLFERLDTRLTEKLVIDENMSAISREQYRRLAAVLHDAQGSSGLQVLMVASAVAGEGKTLTAANLALTFSESY